MKASLRKKKCVKQNIEKSQNFTGYILIKTRTSQEVRFSVFLKNADIIGCDAGKIMSFVKDDDPTVQVEQDDNKVSNIKLIDANGDKK